MTTASSLTRAAGLSVVALLAALAILAPPAARAQSIVTANLQMNLDGTKTGDTWTDDSTNGNNMDVIDGNGGITSEVDPGVLQNIFTNYDFTGGDTTATNATPYDQGEGIRYNNGTSVYNRGAAEIVNAEFSQNDMTFELWINPEDVATRQVLWETGGGTGAGAGLNGTSLFMGVQGTNPDALISGIDLTNINGENLVEGDQYIQVTGVVSLSGDYMELFVNGDSVGSATIGATNWDGGDAFAIGGRGESNFGGRGSGFTFDGGDYGSFTGDISSFRMWGSKSTSNPNSAGALSTAEIIQNLNAVDLQDSVLTTDGEWTTSSNWSLGTPTGTTNAYIVGGALGTISSGSNVANNILVGGGTAVSVVNGAGEGSGQLTIASGLTDVTNDLWVGSHGNTTNTTGTIDVFGGGLVIGRDLDFAAGAGTGNVTRGGALNLTGGSVVIGQSIYSRASANGITQADISVTGGLLDLGPNGVVNSRAVDNFTLDGGTLGLTLTSATDFTALAANTANVGAGGSVGTAFFDIKTGASASADDANAATWTGPGGDWDDSTTSVWDIGATPSGLVASGSTFNLIEANSLVPGAYETGNSTFNVSTSGTNVLLTTNADLSLGAVKAIIDGTSVVTRNAPFFVANTTTGGPIATEVDVLDTAQLIVTTGGTLGGVAAGGGDGIGNLSLGTIAGTSESPLATFAGGLTFEGEGGNITVHGGSFLVNGDITSTATGASALDITGGNASIAGSITGLSKVAIGGTTSVTGEITGDELIEINTNAFTFSGNTIAATGGVADIHVGAAANGAFTVTPGLILSAGDDIAIGGANGGGSSIGTLTNNGGFITTTGETGNSDFIIGNGTANGSAFIQSSGTTIVTRQTRIGDNSGDNNSFDLNGGLFRSGSAFYVGVDNNAGNNTATVAGGTLVIETGNVEAGNLGDVNNPSELILSSGIIYNNAGNLVVAQTGTPNNGNDTNGAYTQTGGTLDLRGEDPFGNPNQGHAGDINVNDGNATVDISGGVAYLDALNLLSGDDNRALTNTTTISGGTVYIRSDIDYRNGTGNGVKTDILNITGGHVYMGNDQGVFAATDDTNTINFQNVADPQNNHQFTFTGGRLDGVDSFINVDAITNTGGTLVQSGGTLGVTQGTTTIDGNYALEDDSTLAVTLDASSPTSAAILVTNGGTAFVGGGGASDSYTIDIDAITAPADASAGSAVTYDGNGSGSGLWDSNALNWNVDTLPSAGSANIAASTDFTIIETAFDINEPEGDAFTNVNTPAGWTVTDGGTALLLTNTGGTFGTGAVRAVIEGTSLVTRNTAAGGDLKINTDPASSTFGTDAAALEVNDTAQLHILDSNNLIVGGNTGEGTVDQNGGLINVSGDLVYGGLVGGDVTLNGGLMSVNGNIGPGNGATTGADLILDGGTLTLGPGSSVNVDTFIVANTPGTSSSFDLTSGRSLNAGYMAIGVSTATGSVNITDSTLIVQTGSGGLDLGLSTGAKGTLVINGASFFDSDGETDIGVNGTGSLKIFGTGTTNLDATFVGRNAGAKGTLLIGDGSTEPTVNLDGVLDIANSSDAQGVVNIVSGTVIHSSGALRIGANANSTGTGTFILGDGSSSSQPYYRTQSGNTELAYTGAAKGIFILNSGTFVQSSNNNIIINQNIDNLGVGTMTQAFMQVNGGVLTFTNFTSNGHLRMNAGISTFDQTGGIIHVGHDFDSGGGVNNDGDGGDFADNTWTMSGGTLNVGFTEGAGRIHLDIARDSTTTANITGGLINVAAGVELGAGNQQAGDQTFLTFGGDAVMRINQNAVGGDAGAFQLGDANNQTTHFVLNSGEIVQENGNVQIADSGTSLVTVNGGYLGVGVENDLTTILDPASDLQFRGGDTTFLQTGGTIAVANQIRGTGGGNATITLSGGAMGGGNFDFFGSGGGTTDVTLSGGTLLVVDEVLGAVAGNTGILTQTAGLATFGSVAWNTGDQTISLSGGTFAVVNNVSLGTGSGAFNIIQDGATITVGGTFIQTATGPEIGATPGSAFEFSSIIANEANLAGTLNVDGSNVSAPPISILAVQTWNGTGVWDAVSSNNWDEANPILAGGTASAGTFNLIQTTGNLTATGFVLDAGDQALWTMNIFEGASNGSINVATKGAIAAGISEAIIIGGVASRTVAEGNLRIEDYNIGLLTDPNVQAATALTLAGGTLDVDGVNFVLGGGNASGTVTHNSGLATVNGDVVFGRNPGDFGGDYILNGGSLVANHIVRADATVSSANLIIDGGDLTLTGGSIDVTTFTLGQAAGTTGSYTATGPNTADDIIVGDAGTGILGLSGGSTTVANDITIGNTATATGTLAVSGAATTVTVDGDINLNSGRGYYEQSGGLVQTDSFTTDAGGDNAGSYEVVVSGGTLNIDNSGGGGDWLRLGASDATSVSSMNQTGGRIVVNDDVIVADGSGSTADLTVDAGVMLGNDGETGALYVGRGPASTANFTMNGGTVFQRNLFTNETGQSDGNAVANVTINGGLFVNGNREAGGGGIGGEYGTGTLRYDDGATIFTQTGGTMYIDGNSDTSLQFDNSAGSASTHTQTGGLTDIVGNVDFRDGEQVVDISGGTFQATGNLTINNGQASFAVSGPTADVSAGGNAVVGSTNGTATLDISAGKFSANTLSVADAAGSTGNFNVSGGEVRVETLDLSGAGTGSYNLTGGTIAPRTANIALDADTPLALNGATLDLEGGQLTDTNATPNSVIISGGNVYNASLIDGEITMSTGEFDITEDAAGIGDGMGGRILNMQSNDITLDGGVIVFDLFSGGGTGNDNAFGATNASGLDMVGNLQIADAVTILVNNDNNATLSTAFVNGDSWDLLGAFTDNGITTDIADFNLPTLSGSLEWDVSDFANTGVITVIPEPSSLLLGLLSSTLLFSIRRRRR